MEPADWVTPFLSQWCQDPRQAPVCPAEPEPGDYSWRNPQANRLEGNGRTSCPQGAQASVLFTLKCCRNSCPTPPSQRLPGLQPLTSEARPREAGRGLGPCLAQWAPAGPRSGEGTAQEGRHSRPHGVPAWPGPHPRTLAAPSQGTGPVLSRGWLWVFQPKDVGGLRRAPRLLCPRLHFF